ncbi:MAG: hypothetical protein SGARI_003165, partial [Bacillariaceae sp.]
MLEQAELASLNDTGAAVVAGEEEEEEDDDDEETLEDIATLEGTLEDTLDGTMRGTVNETVFEVKHLMANATKAMVLALARTAPVEVSRSMAFDNAVDMDNLCRVRTDESGFTTVYKYGRRSDGGPGSRASSRRMKWKHYAQQKASVASSVGSPGSIEASDDDEDDETFQTWNTMDIDDDDEVTHQEDASLIFDMSMAMHGEDELEKSERSDDTRDPPAEHLVLKGDANSNKEASKRNPKWFVPNGSLNKSSAEVKKETKLTIQHQTEHVEIVVDVEKEPSTKEKKQKKTSKGGKRKKVRFWSPKLSKKFNRIMHKGKKSSCSSVASEISNKSSKELKLVCEKSVSSSSFGSKGSSSIEESEKSVSSSSKSSEESTMNESTIVGDTLDEPSCIASVPSDEEEASDHSAPSDTGSVQEVDFGFIQEMPQNVASPDLPTPMESIEEASEVSKLLEEAEDEPSVASAIMATKLLPKELVRDSSEEDGFEIEIS